MQAILGIGILLTLAWLCRERAYPVHWRVVGVGLAVQFALALLFLKVPWISQGLLVLNWLVTAIEAATSAGTSFLFGYLGGGEAPFDTTNPSNLFIFGFRILPQIVVFSVLVAVLWYWRILPWIVRGLGRLLSRSMGVSGPLGTAAAAAIFLGMVETPLVIRAYLAKMSRSDLFAVMTCGMATVAGSVMVIYASVIGDLVDGALGHVLTASIVNVIGAIYVSRLMIPSETQQVESTTDALEYTTELSYASNMDAITRGTTDGVRLAINVAGMLLVLISLVALTNQVLGYWNLDGQAMSLQRLMGWIFAPIAWLIGIPWDSAQIAGSLLGSKIILNELVAFLELANLPADTFSDRSELIMTYALCGFANFGSLAILIAGLSTLAPEKRDVILDISPKSLISGTIVTCITGAIVALITLI